MATAIEPIEEVDEEELEDLESTPAATLLLRKTAKTRFTRLTTKIRDHMASEGSKRELQVLRSQLAEASEECSRLHALYIERSAPTGQRQTVADEWQKSLDDTTRYWFETVEEHLRARKAAASTTTYSSASRLSHSRHSNSVASSTRLREAELRRQVSQLALEQAKQEETRQIEEQTRLAQIGEEKMRMQQLEDIERHRIEAERKTRQQADQLALAELQENLLRDAETQSLPGPDVGSDRAWVGHPILVDDRKETPVHGLPEQQALRIPHLKNPFWNEDREPDRHPNPTASAIGAPLSAPPVGSRTVQRLSQHATIGARPKISKTESPLVAQGNELTGASRPDLGLLPSNMFRCPPPPIPLNPVGTPQVTFRNPGTLPQPTNRPPIAPDHGATSRFTATNGTASSFSQPPPMNANLPMQHPTTPQQVFSNTPNLLPHRPTAPGNPLNIEAWISNLNHSQAVAPSPCPPPRPPKFELKEFSGDAAEYLAFMTGFKVLIHDACKSDAERLFHLRNYLSKEIRDHLGEALLDPTLYHHTLKELHAKYGSPQTVARSCSEKLSNLPAFKDDDFKALRRFSATLRGVVATLRHGGYQNQLESFHTLQMLVSKLPTSLRKRWGKESYRMEPRLPTLADFDTWMDRVYMEESRAQPLKSARQSPDPVKPKQIKPQTVLATSVTPIGAEPATDAVTNKASARCPACNAEHRLQDCLKFKDITVEKRAYLVRDKKCCFRCLGQFHQSRKCKRSKICGKEGCTFKHHPLLHGAPIMYPKKEEKDSDVASVEEPDKMAVTCTARNQKNAITLLPIVPVVLRHREKSIKILALLDTGSEVTLLRKDVADHLQLTGPIEQKIFSTFHSQDPRIQVQKVSFALSSIYDDKHFDVENAYAVDDLNLTRRPVATSKWKAWPHLADIELHNPNTNDVALLIGMDLPEAHDVLDIRKAPSRQNAPRAILTHFGWCVIGKLPTCTDRSDPQCHFTSTLSPDDDVKLRITQFIEGETFGTHPDVKRPIAKDDMRALNILKSTTRCVDGRYECGLPWKHDSPDLPNNHKSAIRRFLSQERRLLADPPLAESYAKAMEELVTLGFARKVSDVELSATPPGRRNFVPHHPVINPNKPGKTRPVFDASAKTNGVSLNDRLLKGPDLLTSMVGVYVRFREHYIAVSADIERMFHQVRVRDEDGPAFSYVWRTPGSKEPLKVFQFTVQIFGAVSSPTVCTYVLRRAAEDNAADFPNILPKVIDNFYADNYLDSFDSIDEAQVTCQQMRDCLLRGGFKLTQWASSSKEVLSALPGDLRSNPKLNLDLEELPTERTLGLLWNCQNDDFNLTVRAGHDGSTKRKVLHAVSAIFDPLGFLVPVVFPAKVLLRDIWSSEADWDDPLEPYLVDRFTTWSSSLEALKTLSVARCFKPSCKQPAKTELHVFADASELGFCAASYLRMEFDEGVHVSFVISKSRIAPKKQLTIPRLELNGAVLAFRISQVVQKELRIPLCGVSYWTDSTTVLRWLYSTNCRYHVFVANRVGEILEGSQPEQWRYVPTRQNPADDGCRGIDATKLTEDHRWFRGPAFLYLPASEWPTFPDRQAPLPQDDPEVKFVGHVLERKTNIFSDLIERRSSVTVMERTAAWVERFLFNIRKSKENRARGPLTAREVQNGLRQLIRATQTSEYAEEMRDLQAKRNLSATSKLCKLSPFIDSDGLLRVGGRIGNSSLPYDTRHPVILPASHRLSNLIVRRLHLDLAHASTERTLTELLQHFWLSRRKVRDAIASCICRRRNAKPSPPFMAALPAHRLLACRRPFDQTGIDLFGPLSVKQLRRTVKRYGVLFTCLSTRAVHLEMVHSLEMGSFIQAFRRFVVRRGQPADCYSDNGTNLTSAEKEINEGVARWNRKLMAEKMGADYLTRNVNWHFNPPAAPHFGGAWERLIQSAKRALYEVLRGRVVTDEILQTALVEIEGLLNGRPLTHVSVDPADPEPLTPNYLLQRWPETLSAPDSVEPGDSSSRKQWRVAQDIVQHFWRRWLREYVPHQTERRKWLHARRNLRVGDIVLLIDNNNPRGTWPLGRVLETFPGADGVVRSARVKTKHGEYHRPALKLCLLEEAASTPDVFVPENRAGDVPDGPNAVARQS